ncbi:MAG: spondin domain-containing protein, partial [Acidiferrobacterales bacterium]
VATHRRGPSLFEVGQVASEELLTVAESGNTAPLTDALLATGKVADIKTTAGLLSPGQTVTVVVNGGKGIKHISIAAMLLPTNDAFFSLNAVRLPGSSKTSSYYSPAYDAGSETNDELCINIPGPHCGGIGLSPDDSGEGYVHIHAGIHGIGSLDASTYDWRNPVAKIRIRRL